MNKEYILLARAKGASEMTIFYVMFYPTFAAPCSPLSPSPNINAGRRGTDRNRLFMARYWRYLTTALFAGDTTAIMGGTL